MGLPGGQVNLVDTPPAPGRFTDIGTLFAVGQAPNAVALDEVRSIEQFEAVAGIRNPASPMWDSMQVFFKEGGSKAYVSTVAMTGLDADLIATLANFTSDLGPGQIAAFGHTTAILRNAVMAAAIATDRCSLHDAANSSVVATPEAAAAGAHPQNGSRFASMFWPWDIAPGLTTGATTRVVPPTARIAGNIAYNDGRGLSPNDPAAGPNGIAQYIQGLSQPALSDTDRAAFNDAGINVSRIVLGGVRTYGWRSLVDPTLDPDWKMFSNSRTIMAIKNALNIMLENFVFNKIDGRQVTVRKFQGAIIGELTQFWSNDDLFGSTASEAFSVDVGPAVNTLATLAAGELHAKVGLKTSPFSEQVIIDVAKIPITDAIAA